MKDVILLALESSCDETACAIVKNGKEILSSKVASQIDVHTRYYAAAFGESGEHVTLLNWNDLLEMLEVTEKNLSEMDMPTINPKEKRQRNTVYYSSGEVSNTLGDQLKAKGIDLQALIK